MHRRARRRPWRRPPWASPRRAARLPSDAAATVCPAPGLSRVAEGSRRHRRRRGAARPRAPPRSCRPRPRRRSARRGEAVRGQRRDARAHVALLVEGLAGLDAVADVAEGQDVDHAGDAPGLALVDGEIRPRAMRRSPGRRRRGRRRRGNRTRSGRRPSPWRDRRAGSSRCRWPEWRRSGDGVLWAISRSPSSACSSARTRVRRPRLDL